MLAVPERFQQVVIIVRIDGTETQFSGSQVDGLQLPCDLLVGHFVWLL